MKTILHQVLKKVFGVSQYHFKSALLLSEHIFKILFFFLVWSANYSPFGHIDCVIQAESNPSSKTMAIMGSKPHYGCI